MSKLAEMNKKILEAHQKLDNLDRPARDASAVIGTPGNPRQVPWGTSGPVGQDSKHFSMYSFLRNGVTVKGGRAELAKHEMGVCEKFGELLRKSGNMISTAGADSDGAIWLPNNLDGFTPELTASTEGENTVTYIKAVMAAPKPAFDPDEFKWLQARGIIKAGAQSAFFANQGTEIVAPATQGSVIPLVRPNAALLAAGASTMTLPPSGKYVEPRITSAPTVTAIAESADYTTSNLGTDQMVLQSKKIGGAVYLSKESSLYTSGTMDQFVQSELNRSLGLKFDAYGFYGSGGSAIPQGLIYYTGSNQVIDVFGTYTQAKGLGTNGNTLQPEYGDKIPALLEERSFGLDGDEGGTWIMRPYALSGVRSQRASAVQPKDQEGPFVDILRRFSEGGPDQWAGRKVVKSTNLRNDQTKGTGTGLSDAFYGLWKYMVVATYGAIQFEQGFDGNTFLRDQIIIKGTMFGDIGLRYPGAFAWLKQIVLAAPQL